MTRYPEPRTEGERLLAAYFVERGWERGPDWQYEPWFEEHRRRPDFRLRIGERRCMLEMKEFGPSEAPTTSRRRGRHARIAAKIRAARRQLREFHGDHACAVVLRSGDEPDTDVGDPAVVLGALLRDPTFFIHLGAAWRGPWRTSDRDSPVDAVLTMQEVAGSIAVTVIEHPGAPRRFPSHLFDGAWDACWSLRDGTFERVFAGAALRASESKPAAA